VSKDRPGWNAAAIVLWYWFSERNGSRESLSKNKVLIFGVFLATRKHAANSPRLPPKLPQLHQRITKPKNTQIRKNPLQKREKAPPPTTPKNIAKVSSQPSFILRIPPSRHEGIERYFRPIAGLTNFC
jgi:hypothetical protein